MTDVENRAYLGYSLVVVTFLDVVICLGLVVMDIWFQIARKLKLKYLALA